MTYIQGIVDWHTPLHFWKMTFFLSLYCVDALRKGIAILFFYLPTKIARRL